MPPRPGRQTSSGQAIPSLAVNVYNAKSRALMVTDIMMDDRPVEGDLLTIRFPHGADGDSIRLDLQFEGYVDECVLSGEHQLDVYLSHIKTSWESSRS